jgi:hypothetical protein
MTLNWFLFYSIMIVKISNSSLQITNEIDNCQYSLKDGSIVNFTHLKRRVDYGFQINRFIYKANFCGSLANQCPGSLTPAGVFLNSGSCLYKLVHKWENTYLDYIDTANPSKGVKLIFPPGDRCNFSGAPFQLSYVLNCDESKEIDFNTILKLGTCNYEYHFYTKYGCQSNFQRTDSNFTSKKILFIIILTFSLYCIGFSYINFKNNPEDGLMKALPHRDFWLEFLENTQLGANVIYKYVKNRFRANQVNNYEF